MFFRFYAFVHDNSFPFSLLTASDSLYHAAVLNNLEDWTSTIFTVLYKII